ncbi:hypothetical protein FF38_13146 [Lucilia cuprina]|uniref:Uncharacterized protein n=1 Tax=Lucilia cuprina TaxID=7375 RepID=A0A0L0CA02_LUCCU|nr:hypothetical protein FF38_13146 [Lucilia cuprina]
MFKKLSQARYGYVPKSYGPDAALVVEKALGQNHNVGGNYPNTIRIPPPFPLWRHYPRYHIIPPPPPGQIMAINTWAKTAHTKPIIMPTTTSTTTTTTTSTTTPKPTTSTTSAPTTKFTTSSPFITDDEFPTELLDIAQNKLGLKSLDEIPSISELGQLLGTNSPEETLSYIRQLTSNEQGVALMKAYIESTDYTDNTENSYKNKENIEDGDDEEDDDDDMGDIEEPVKVNDEGLIVITDDDSNGDYVLSNEGEEETTSKPTLKPRKTPKIIQKLKELPNTHPSFMERIMNYMHLNNLFHKNSGESGKSKEYHELNRITENGKKISNNKQKDNQENQTESEIVNNDSREKTNLKTENILASKTIPYNYPIPIRSSPTSTSSTTTTTTTPSPPVANTQVVHLNTPKMLIPHVQQLSRVTKIPSKKIEDFLASKPKLLELATKVSRFPIGYDRNSPMEAQVMAAVQKAIEQDEDLKKLLSSTATLK